MTTHHYIPDYNYTPNNNDRRRDHAYIPSKQTGSIPNRTKNGLYNIIEKEVNGHKVLNYVPLSYGSDYDLSQLDEEPPYEEQPKYYSPVSSRHQPFDNRDDDDYSPTPRRDVYVSPRRPQVIKRVYFDPALALPPPTPPPSPSPRKIEYIYERDYGPRNEEPVEYIVRDRVPRKRYVEVQPIRQTVYVETLPPISRSPRVSPSLRSVKPHRLDEYSSPRRSRMTQQTSRETPIRVLSQNRNEPKYISLKEVLAENRAKRGPRIPKPRREVDEEQSYDLPTYRKNFVKNDFMVHK